MLCLETSHSTLLGTHLGKTHILSELRVSIPRALAFSPLLAATAAPTEGPPIPAHQARSRQTGSSSPVGCALREARLWCDGGGWEPDQTQDPPGRAPVAGRRHRRWAQHPAHMGP